jgi:hypothetical protein
MKTCSAYNDRCFAKDFVHTDIERYVGEDLSLNEPRTMAITSVLFTRKRISILWYKHH